MKLQDDQIATQYTKLWHTIYIYIWYIYTQFFS